MDGVPRVQQCTSRVTKEEIMLDKPKLKINHAHIAAVLEARRKLCVGESFAIVQRASRKEARK